MKIIHEPWNPRTKFYASGNPYGYTNSLGVVELNDKANKAVVKIIYKMLNDYQPKD